LLKNIFLLNHKPLGTSSIVHEITHHTLLSKLSAVVETVIDLKRHGHKVVLVSSGAIGVGLKRMNMESRPKHLSGKQACAVFLFLFLRLLIDKN
jgi:glutamate 5-kinase